ncbi:MAG: alpha-galactosidase [Prevotellaceae bacterium]|nr:alpha-galactosidase [Prevotellaceae bacterium]
MRKAIITTALLALTALGNAQNPKAPLMGWSSWNTFALNISDDLIRGQALAMTTSGLKAAGYCYVNIDDGYFYGRDERGNLLVNPTTFPQGLRPVVDYIHSLGLKAGIYSDAGHSTCGCYGTQDPLCLNVGLYGHDQQDADLFFSQLGFDFIKVDFCGGSPGANSERLRLSERDRYTDIAQAILNTGRKGVRMNACRWAYPGTWIEGVCESWRTTGDINLSWGSVRSIIAENLYLADYSSEGHFNDMDMLEVGRGLTEEEDKTHFALWCVLNSPLLIGCDMRDISPETLSLLTNKELIAVNQDKTFQQAYVARKAGECYVLVRDVEKTGGKTRVVAVYNPSDTNQDVSFLLSDIDLSGQKTTLRDLFYQADATATVLNPSSGTVSLSVPAHGTRVYKVKGEKRLERTRYEAETAYIPAYQEIENNQSLETGAYTYDPQCSGGLKATWLGRSERNCLQFRHVVSQKGGKYRLTIAYLSGEERSLQVLVNGTEAKRLTTEEGSWAQVRTLSLEVQLRKGENNITLANPAGWMPDIDFIDLQAI